MGEAAQGSAWASLQEVPTGAERWGVGEAQRWGRLQAPHPPEAHPRADAGKRESGAGWAVERRGPSSGRRGDWEIPAASRVWWALGGRFRSRALR